MSHLDTHKVSRYNHATLTDLPSSLFYSAGNFNGDEMETDSATTEFKRWATSFSGCDGGDMGTESSPSIWVCGIEWGGGWDDATELQKEMAASTGTPPIGYTDYKHNLAYTYNRQTMKLLSAINGGRVEDYEQFALEQKPFVLGESGYFKFNLYPISFKNTNHALWIEEFSEVTGLKSKQSYLEWCRENRFPVIKAWAQRYKPKLIICFGKTYKSDFMRSFTDIGSAENHEKLMDRDLFWYRSGETMIAICPFPVNRNGLNSNARLQAFGDRIRSLCHTV